MKSIQPALPPRARPLLLLLLLPALLLTGCPPPETPLFSFGVIADPHVYGGPSSENALKLAAVVDWINANKDLPIYGLELVFVVGDLGGGAGLGTAREILDGLTVPYVPLIGDNEIHGDEQLFHDTFAPRYAELASTLENWSEAPAPVWNPQWGKDSWFQNHSFDYQGIHFVAADWASRGGSGIEGEQADLHDFAGGTWPWFAADLAGCPKDFGENIVLLSHHPMHVSPVFPDLEVASFSPDEVDVIEGLTATYGDHVSADLAGHYHIDWYEDRPGGQYELYVTEAVHMGVKNLRLVKVYNDGSAFHYDHVRVVVAP